MARAYLGLGGNLGHRRASLQLAVGRIRERFPLVAASPLYETAPVGYLDQPAFLNAVVAVDAPDNAHEFFRVLLEVERELGRQRTFANAPRTIDIDLLLFSDQVFETDELTVPHPRMHERAFVLVPLAEVAPKLVHPALGMTISELLDELGESSSGVERIEGPGWIDANGPPDE